jgi:hypothetical protein
MSTYPLITAGIGGIIVLAFATLTWKKRKGALAEALATKNVLEPSEEIVKEHGAELTIGRKQLTITLSDGRVDDSKWLEKRDLFIDQIIEPQVGNITNSLERLLAVWHMIDVATAQFAASRTTEPAVPPIARGDRIETLKILDAPSTIAVVGRAASSPS